MRIKTRILGREISMKRLNIALLAAALFALAPVSANAAASTAVSLENLCAPDSAGTVRGPRQVTNPSTGNTFNLNQNGCALMKQGEWPYFLSQGYYVGAGKGAIFAGPYTAQSTAANSPTLPANAHIDAIIVQETTGNAVTGGLDVGVAGSSDATIVSAAAIAANCVCSIAQAAILKTVFPTSGTAGPTAQQIYFNAHTNWTDGATIYVTILYSYF